MLDGNSQMILGDSVPGSLTSSTPKSAFQPPKLEPFCGDVEGWGPLSKFRFDLTPCFLDVGVAIVAVWGLTMGAGAIWFLLKKRIPQPVSKNWHFYAKLVSSCTPHEPCQTGTNTLSWLDCALRFNVYHGSPSGNSGRDLCK
jgi:hypothetical protein